jgi:hypothetical protein
MIPMRRKYWLVEILDEQTRKPYASRWAEGSTPQEACKYAYGTVYDSGNARAKEFPNPKHLSQKKLREMKESEEGWIVLGLPKSESLPKLHIFKVGIMVPGDISREEIAKWIKETLEKDEPRIKVQIEGDPS